MDVRTLLVRRPPIRSFMSLFSDAGDVMKRCLSAALVAAFHAGREWGRKPLAGETAFLVELDGVMQVHTLRMRARDCREDYARATHKTWVELQKVGFRVRKVHLVPVLK